MSLVSVYAPGASSPAPDIGPASEHLLTVTEQVGDQPVELFVVVSAGEHVVYRRGETWGIEHRFGAVGKTRPKLRIF
jgi:hypothetical protein